MSEVVVITKDEAEAALRSQHAALRDGTTCGHTGCEDHPSYRPVIHCLSGPFGADWDLENAVQAVRDAQAVQWRPGNWLGHELYVLTNLGRQLLFAVLREEPTDITCSESDLGEVPE